VHRCIVFVSVTVQGTLAKGKRYPGASLVYQVCRVGTAEPILPWGKKEATTGYYSDGGVMSVCLVTLNERRNNGEVFRE
jgi:hypothetical protein